ncbi:hypothetical protein EDD15DRAFT_2315955 [Pisolithus albus]|nr:hypothetical protein EDD15DRAFT_2315955 [Pisolithus albus]
MLSARLTIRSWARFVFGSLGQINLWLTSSPRSRFACPLVDCFIIETCIAIQSLLAPSLKKLLGHVDDWLVHTCS